MAYAVGKGSLLAQNPQNLEFQPRNSEFQPNSSIATQSMDFPYPNAFSMQEKTRNFEFQPRISEFQYNPSIATQSMEYSCPNMFFVQENNRNWSLQANPSNSTQGSYPPTQNLTPSTNSTQGSYPPIPNLTPSTTSVTSNFAKTPKIPKPSEFTNVAKTPKFPKPSEFTHDIKNTEFLQEPTYVTKTPKFPKTSDFTQIAKSSKIPKISEFTSNQSPKISDFTPNQIPKIASPTQPMKKRALDLFSGTGSVAHALRKQGYEVFTLDVNPHYHANFMVDILEWPVEKLFKPGFFHLVAASPPCTEYSSAMTRRPRNMEEADLLVKRTIDIINYLRPPLWWIENPRFGRLHTRSVVFGLPYIDIDFCRFSTWGYQKPTRFWCCKAIASKGNIKCDGKCVHLVPSPHGGLRHKYVIGNKCRDGPPNQHQQVLKIPENVVHFLTGFMAPPKNVEDNSQESWNLVGPENKIFKAEKNRSCPMREVHMQPWHHLSHHPFRMGKVEHRGGALQLMVEVEISVCGQTKKIKALIDTGAQANLLREDLFPSEIWKSSKNPLALTTVNGEILSGGRREVQTKINFHVEPEEKSENKCIQHDMEFHCKLLRWCHFM